MQAALPSSCRSSCVICKEIREPSELCTLSQSSRQSAIHQDVHTSVTQSYIYICRGGPSPAGLTACTRRPPPSAPSTLPNPTLTQPCPDILWAAHSLSQSHVGGRRTQIAGCGIDSRHRLSLGHARAAPQRRDLRPTLATAVAAATVPSHAGKCSTATLVSSVRMLEATMSGVSTFCCAQRGTPARTNIIDIQS